jgi:hypothetical protein
LFWRGEENIHYLYLSFGYAITILQLSNWVIDFRRTVTTLRLPVGVREPTPAKILPQRSNFYYNQNLVASHKYPGSQEKICKQIIKLTNAGHKVTNLGSIIQLLIPGSLHDTIVQTKNAKSKSFVVEIKYFLVISPEGGDVLSSHQIYVHYFICMYICLSITPPPQL